MDGNNKVHLPGRLAQMVLRRHHSHTPNGEYDFPPFDGLLTSPSALIEDRLTRRQGRELAPSTIDAVRTAATMITAGLSMTVVSAIDYAITSCESPIEELMLCALLVTIADRWENVYLIDGSCPWGYFENGYFELGGIFAGRKPYVSIIVQPSIGTYRADFLIERHTWPGLSEQSRPFTSQVIVECDGHEYHERTKQQASRDKRRDRALQTLGFRVFRYTGSDLWADALQCADEVWDLLEADHSKAVEALRSDEKTNS